MTKRTRETGKTVEHEARDVGKHPDRRSDRETSGREPKCPPTSASVVALYRRNGFVNHDPGLLGDETLVVLVREGLAAAAERMSMSKRTLRRRIRETGTTVSEVVQSTRRVLRLRLLQQGEAISEISSLLGYESGRCFSRFILREFGETPTQLHRRLREAEGFD